MPTPPIPAEVVKPLPVTGTVTGYFLASRW
jgi:hypothetical protein